MVHYSDTFLLLFQKTKIIFTWAKVDLVQTKFRLSPLNYLKILSEQTDWIQSEKSVGEEENLLYSCGGAPREVTVL